MAIFVVDVTAVRFACETRQIQTVAMFPTSIRRDFTKNIDFVAMQIKI
jgi:hypothetical protein